ncbi:MAG: hypothetical protein IJP44_03080 [Bacteroidales bacterium]|nr:hypothetical protein [Bacteroidales bacterium]
MKRFLFISICLLQCLVVKSQSLYQCQYWFDQDSVQTVMATFNGNTAQMELDAGSLSAGIHELFIQVKDTTGLWCATQSYMFYKAFEPVNPANPENVTYHCWFDEDFEQEQSGSFGTGQFLLDATNIGSGLHTLFVALESDGLTSTQSYMFFKAYEPVNPTNPENVTYHCWFDEDFEHEQTGSFGTGQFLLDATNIESGLHTLFVALESDGLTSTQNYMFFKAYEPVNPANPENVTYHCWFDEDFEHEQTGSFGTGQFLLDASNIESGLHTLFVALESDGLTSTQSYMFYKAYEPVNPANPENVTYHCWFDEDFEHEQTGTFGTGVILLNARGLTEGEHIVNIMLESESLTSTQSYSFEKHFVNGRDIITITNPTMVAGTVSGAGRYEQGDTCTLVAAPNGMFGFINWTNEGNVVSDSTEYSFIVTEDATYEANFDWTNPASVDYISDGLIMYLDGICNTRNGHDTTATVWEDLIGNYDLTINNYSSYTWEDNHFLGLGNGGYLNTDKTWKYFNSLNDDITIEIVTYIDCDKTSPSYRGIAGWHGGSDGTNIQNDQGSSRMQTLGALPVTEADDMISTISYTRYNGSFLNGSWKINDDRIRLGVNSNYTAVFGNSYAQSRGWNDSIYCIRMYCRSLSPEEIAYNHSIDVERFGASSSNFYGIIASANPSNGGSVSGAGAYEAGQICTLTATANENYVFYNWTENGMQVSIDPTYSFTVTGNRTLVANFIQIQPDSYLISTMVNPVGSGTVTGGGGYTQGSVCTLTATPAEGYFFLNWTQNGNVVSSNPTYTFTVTSNATYTANFTLGLPDLHVTGITHSDFMAGQPVTVSWTVQNDGVGSTPVGGTWNDYVWIASTVDLRIGDPNDIHLATVDNLMALDPGESYTNTVTVTLPSDIAGSQYIFVLTDMVDAFNISFPNNLPPDPYTPSITGDPYYYFTGQTHGANAGGVISETNDYDNFFYKSVQVIPAPAPDLVVTNIAHPTDIISGMSMPLSFTVENQGVATAVGSWYDAVYLSQSSTFNLATAFHLGSYQHENGLAVGQSYTYSTNVDIPREFYDSHYVFVVTDVTNAVYESIFEDNNVVRSETPVNITMSACPNLVVTSITAPSAMSVNKSYDISFTVQNIGAGAATENGWNDVVYLSRDEVWDYGDIAIKVIRHNNSNPLIQDATYTCNTNVSIPGNTSNGIWYVLVKTDKDNEVFEFLDEDDNVGHTENPSTILIPELAVTELWIDDVVNPNVPTEVEWTVKNNGDGLALGVLTDLIAFESQIVDTVTTHIHLESNDSVVISKMITVPCVSLSSGIMSVISNADFNIIDADSTNNVIDNTVSVIVPDLLVEETSISEEGWSGEPIEVKYAVTNNGTASLNKTTTDRIFISNNQNDFSDATLVYSYQRMLSLGMEETENVDLSMNLPDGIYGTYYIGVFANADGEVCEGNNTNGSSIVSAINVSLSPYPNLQVVSASIESTLINIGAYATVSYSVQNVGDAAVNGRTWTDRFYVSPTPSYNENTAELIGEHRTTATIAVNETIDVSTSMIIPMSINAGNYYLVMITDANDELYEFNGENDNLYIGAGYQFDVYPCDLQAMAIGGSSEVDWGSTATFTLHGKNVSDVTTLYSQWNDKLYLSADNLLSGDDIEIGNTAHNGHLEPVDEYQTVFYVTIPYGMAGECYLIGVVDSQFANPDINPQNNFVAEAITVNAVPTPDLQLTDISVIDDFVAGQPSRIVYTVTNVGEIAVENKQWNDRFYLSDDDAYSSEDLQLKTNAKHLSLNVNESYCDTVEIVIPFQYGGNNYLIAKANATQSFYEPNFDDNILGAMVHVTIPSPGDLIVQNVVSEFEVVSGDRLHVSWDVKNIGENTLHGSGLKTLVYMSCDTVFDVNDKLLGSVTNSIMLPPNATSSQELSARVSGVPEGDYYLMVMTNATRTFNESDFDNNTTVSNNPFSVLMRVLPFNVPLTDTLENNLANDYRLNVGEFIQETVRIHLHSADSLQGAINNIFVTHNGVGDNLNYDYSTIEQFTANPELYIPSTQLEYYGVNVIGSTPVDNEQSIMLQADILPFDLRNISPTYGGNTGKVTIELTGSKFSVDMSVKLFNAEETIIADTVYFQSFYKAYATFDLKDKSVGFYSIGISNLCEGDAYLENAFEIRQGEPERLSINIIYPNSPRPNRNIIMMLEFGNTGNVDITAPVIRLTSVGGSWIALTSEGLANHETDMLIPLQIEGAPQGVLRPGSYGIINIFCYTSNALVFTIRRIQ